MPLFRQSQIQKHAPKTITLPSLYKHSLGLGDLGAKDKIEIMEALQKSGYNYSSASKILSGKDLDIAKAKEIAGNLSKAGLKGFAGANSNKMVNEYVRKEAIKKKNVAGIRREFMMEALQEDIYKDKTPRLKNDKNMTGLATPKSRSGKIKLGF